MKSTIGLYACALLLCAASSPSYGFNTLFADKMPIGRMTAEDIDIMLAAAYKALDDLPDGKTSRWENPKTGAGGYLTPRATYRESGLACRDLQVENSAGGLSNRSVFGVCKQADGTWKVSR
jgi:surface antigen